MQACFASATAPDAEPAVARRSRRCNARRLFRGANPMNHQAFTNDSLTMYEGIRGALAADEALKRQGIETRFRLRETPEWKCTPLNSRPKCSGAE
jgi:hypothetical protein